MDITQIVNALSWGDSFVGRFIGRPFEGATQYRDRGIVVNVYLSHGKVERIVLYRDRGIKEFK